VVKFSDGIVGGVVDVDDDVVVESGFSDIVGVVFVVVVVDTADTGDI
jgi:hypothetical protein